MSLEKLLRFYFVLRWASTSSAARRRGGGSVVAGTGERAVLGLEGPLDLGEALRTQAVLVDGDELARLDLANETSAHDVECGGL